MLRVTVPPALSAVTLAEAKAHLHVDFDDDDSLIQIYLKASIDNLDGPGGWLGRALVSQTLELRLDAFPAGAIRLPCPPLIEVSSVVYLDGGGSPQTLSPLAYQALGVGGERPASIRPAAGATWPAHGDHAEAVRITYRAGYVDTSKSPPTGEVPGAIRAGLLLMIGDLYAVRETEVIGVSVARSATVENLLNPKRVPYLP